uniref:Uncharacterized protein n=1 Tax=Euplotes crassus TaxID=5936 RepID=A0A7S3KP92_EUPCR|mmetsp:Transcript_34060/g.33604  ORF Transcript_34060/g.33604 Transcript_34060/m.33604 type:complete len:110 (+) Transcript_34060:889-1218(+)
MINLQQSLTEETLEKAEEEPQNLTPSPPPVNTNALNAVRKSIERQNLGGRLQEEEKYSKEEPSQKKSNFDQEDDQKRLANIEKIKKREENIIIEERESEYFGSQISKNP